MVIYLFYENPNSTISGLYFDITGHDDASPQYLGSNFIDTVEMTKSTRFTTSKSWFSNVAHNWNVILCLNNVSEDGIRNSVCYMPTELDGAWEILAYGNFNLSSNNYKIESLIQTS